MKISTSISPKSFTQAALTLLIFVALALPASAYASVHITEVMYDAPGSDSGHEWVEITNTGASEVNIYGYKFFENGTNHGLVVVSGTSTLAAGGSAIIANDAAKFVADFPQYSSTLFKSAFSLSNTGETIALKDVKLVTVDSISYTSKNGAGGDGNSLHVSQDAFIAGAPNPGSTAATAPVVKPAIVVPSKKSSSSKTASNSFGKSAVAYTAPSGEVGAQTSMPAATPATDPIWLYGLGLAALVLLGVGAVLYAQYPKGPVTQPLREEFELE